MTVRERNLLFVLLGAAGVVFGAILVMQWFVNPYQNANRAIKDLDDEVAEKAKLIDNVRLEQKRLEKYKLVSLPGNPDQAAADYGNYLKAVLRICKLQLNNLTGPPPGSIKMPPAQGKKAAHLPLTFSVNATGDVAGVVKTLRELKSSPIAHRVKSLSLDPAEAGAKGSGLLNIQMTVEALIVHKADSINPFLAAPDGRLVIADALAALRRAPVGLALGAYLSAKASLKAIVEEEDAVLARNYLRIPDRDPFKGAVPIAAAPPKQEKELTPLPGFDILEYVKLIHTSPTANEAFLYNRVFREPEIRLRPKKASGYEYFVIRNEERDRLLLKGKVLKVDQRDVYFQVGEDVYGIHIGHSLAEAMRRSLSDEEMKQLELTSLYDAKFAEEEMAKKAPAKTPTKGGPKTPKKR